MFADQRIGKEHEVLLLVTLLTKLVDDTGECAVVSPQECLRRGADQLVQYCQRVEVRERQLMKLITKLIKDNLVDELKIKSLEQFIEKRFFLEPVCCDQYRDILREHRTDVRRELAASRRCSVFRSET